MLVPKDSSEGLSGITTSLWHSAQKRRALLCHLSGKNGPLGARIWVVTNRIIKLRAMYSSHNLLSASVFCFFIINCVQHANSSLLPQIPHCYPLQEGNRAQIREGTCSGHPASWDMLESSLLAPGPGSWARCLPQAASAAAPSSSRQGKASALKPSPPGTSRWINYLRLCLALYHCGSCSQDEIEPQKSQQSRSHKPSLSARNGPVPLKGGGTMISGYGSLSGRGEGEGSFLGPHSRHPGRLEA